jgi:hypothetical protein
MGPQQEGEDDQKHTTAALVNSPVRVGKAEEKSDVHHL